MQEEGENAPSYGHFRNARPPAYFKKSGIFMERVSEEDSYHLQSDIAQEGSGLPRHASGRKFISNLRKAMRHCAG
jgi:hypothetical protein